MTSQIKEVHKIPSKLNYSLKIDKTEEYRKQRWKYMLIPMYLFI